MSVRRDIVIYFSCCVFLVFGIDRALIWLYFNNKTQNLSLIESLENNLPIKTSYNDEDISDFLLKEYMAKSDYIKVESKFDELHRRDPYNLDYISEYAHFLFYTKCDELKGVDLAKKSFKIQKNRNDIGLLLVDYSISNQDYDSARYYFSFIENNHNFLHKGYLPMIDKSNMNLMYHFRRKVGF